MVRQCSSNSMVLKKRSDFMLESHTAAHVILVKYQHIRKIPVPPVHMVLDQYHLSVTSFHLVPQEFCPGPLQGGDHE